MQMLSEFLLECATTERKSRISDSPYQGFQEVASREVVPDNHALPESIEEALQ